MPSRATTRHGAGRSARQIGLPPDGPPRRARARFPARPARGGAGLRGDLRRLAGGRRVHRRLRRGGHRGALRGALAADVVPPATETQRADLPRAAPALPARDRVARPARLRARDLVVERVGARRAARHRRRPRLLLPQPLPLRLVRARGDARRPQRAAAAPAAGRPLALAAMGLDRRPAGRSVRGELATHRLEGAPLLRPRGGRAAPAGRARAVLPGAGRRPLPGGRRADAAQADRRRRPRVQPAAPDR